jgi:hypothetical protein
VTTAIVAPATSRIGTTLLGGVEFPPTGTTTETTFDSGLSPHGFQDDAEK